MEQEKSHKRNKHLNENKKIEFVFCFCCYRKETKEKAIDNQMNIFYDGDWQHITDFY